MSILILSLCLLRSHLTAAAPLQNYSSSSNETAPTWVSAPARRGTWDILGSCLSTLGLCVWKSLHLNVPAMDESDWTKYFRKAKWVMIALLAPEAVVFAGFRQWVAARSFLRRIQFLHRKHFPAHGKKPNGDTTKAKFDMEYAMYAVMGGFIVDIRDVHNKLTLATLTTHGMLLLAKEGKFVSPYPGSISTKSQMDILTKAFVCCQALSFIGQVIERKVMQLTISLLEVNTAVHIVCTVVMYAFWMRKPYNIQDPTLVAMDDRPDLLAFIVTSSRWPHNSGFDTAQPKSRKNKIRSKLAGSFDPPFYWFGSLTDASSISNGPIDELPRDTSEPDKDANTPACGDPVLEIPLATIQCETSDLDQEALCHPDPSLMTYLPVSAAEPMLYLQSGQVLASGFGPADDPDLTGASQGRYQIGLSRKDLNRLNLAAKYMRKLLGSYKESLISRDSFVGGTCVSKVHLSKPFADKALQPFGNRLICSRVENCPTLEQLLEADSDAIYLLFIAVTLTTAAYGALHMFTNPSLLPTQLEKNLWSLSCMTLYLMAWCLCGIVIYKKTFPIFMKWSKTPHWSWTAKSLALFRQSNSIYQAWSKHSKSWRISLLVGAGLLSFAYISTRAFIIIESFISLRHVPIDVYQTPNVTYLGFVPHIS